jgi:hypothetical protein
MKRYAIALLFLCAFVRAQPPAEADRKAMEGMGRGEGTLQPGDAAPDFDLRKTKSDERVSLSAFRNRKPVALLFGSYT